eukprot:gene15831-17427_t
MAVLRVCGVLIELHEAFEQTCIVPLPAKTFEVSKVREKDTKYLTNCFCQMKIVILVSVLLEYVRGGFVDQMKKFPCYHKKYQLKKFYCVNDFFLSFREDPFQDCRKRVRAMVACQVAVNKECLSLAEKDSLIYSIYVRVLSKSKSENKMKRLYCRNAGLVSKFIGKKAMQTVGCNADFYIRKHECIEQFQKKWRHNRSSMQLERGYTDMEKCIENNLQVHCSKRTVDKMKKFGKDILSELSVNWNPFRVYSRDNN